MGVGLQEMLMDLLVVKWAPIVDLSQRMDLLRKACHGDQNLLKIVEACEIGIAERESGKQSLVGNA